jgi:hypothetical protein
VAARRLDIVVPVGGVSFVVGEDDTHTSHFCIVEALEGDDSRLLSRLQAGAILSQNERNFLAGTLPRAPNRPAKRATRSRDFKITWLVKYLRRFGGRGREDAIYEAMEVFAVERTTVTNALRKVRSDPGRWMLLEATLPQTFSEDELQAFIAGLRCRAAMSVTRYRGKPAKRARSK